MSDPHRTPNAPSDDGTARGSANPGNLARLAHSLANDQAVMRQVLNANTASLQQLLDLATRQSSNPFAAIESVSVNLRDPTDDHATVGQAIGFNVVTSGTEGNSKAISEQWNTRFQNMTRKGRDRFYNLIKHSHTIVNGEEDAKSNAAAATATATATTAVAAAGGKKEDSELKQELQKLHQSLLEKDEELAKSRSEVVEQDRQLAKKEAEIIELTENAERYDRRQNTQRNPVSKGNTAATTAGQSSKAQPPAQAANTREQPPVYRDAFTPRTAGLSNKLKGRQDGQSVPERNNSSSGSDDDDDDDNVGADFEYEDGRSDNDDSDDDGQADASSHVTRPPPAPAPRREASGVNNPSQQTAVATGTRTCVRSTPGTAAPGASTQNDDRRKSMRKKPEENSDQTPKKIKTEQTQQQAWVNPETRKKAVGYVDMDRSPSPRMALPPDPEPRKIKREKKPTKPQPSAGPDQVVKRRRDDEGDGADIPDDHFDQSFDDDADPEPTQSGEEEVVQSWEDGLEARHPSDAYRFGKRPAYTVQHGNSHQPTISFGRRYGESATSWPGAPANVDDNDVDGPFQPVKPHKRRRIVQDDDPVSEAEGNFHKPDTLQKRSR